MPKPRNTDERRANLARLSLRLGTFAVPLVALAFVVPGAQAEQPETVALTGTNPPSSLAKPAASVTPLIEGRGDGAIISVVKPFGFGTRSPIASAGTSPANEVNIYANATCAGSPVQNGIVEASRSKSLQTRTRSSLRFRSTPPTQRIPRSARNRSPTGTVPRQVNPPKKNRRKKNHQRRNRRSPNHRRPVSVRPLRRGARFRRTCARFPVAAPTTTRRC